MHEVSLLDLHFVFGLCSAIFNQQLRFAAK